MPIIQGARLSGKLHFLSTYWLCPLPRIQVEMLWHAASLSQRVVRERLSKKRYSCVGQSQSSILHHKRSCHEANVHRLSVFIPHQNTGSAKTPSQKTDDGTEANKSDFFSPVLLLSGGGVPTSEMLHAENKVKLLECQDEITVEPCSKKMKSTERAYEKLSDDNQGIQKEMDVERTLNDLMPVYASDNEGQHEMQKQDKIPTGALGTVNEVLPDYNLVLGLPTDRETVQNVNLPVASVNDTEVGENKEPFITDNAGEDNNRNSNLSFSIKRNASDEEFFTSKEFIGPVYKPANSNKQEESGSCNVCRDSGGDQNELHEKRAERKKAKKLQTMSSAVPEIDDELDQFYKEIHQLENENLDTAFQEKETETSQEQYSPYNCSQTSQEDYQHAFLGSPQPFYETGQCFSGEQKTEKTSNEQQFLLESRGWKTENTLNGQVDSKYWNYSVPEFRPAWQSTESSIVPQSLLAPRFNHQSHFQILNSPPEKTNALPSHNGELFYKNYHGYRGHTSINHHGPLLDQSTNYTGTHTTQVFRNGNNEENRLQNNEQNQLQSNGFCETREECWKDPKADNTEEICSSSSLQLPEERFGCSQKWLLILRGLPGSGKSTLSRILLGQSRDGIVLSTDDYFRQQDGYTYNAAQLGDAHDWNQKRAKQAMEQGKSPVIIDNTNTQAWEMKPYVEVALEKGYRVEFHEPDTWWKFDPEELEKRNKHGVTREKIAQMLERYEYQISIPVVLNSVVPPHKNTQRPPLHRRHREKILKNCGHLRTNGKQRKKRKRNKKMKGHSTEITKKKLGGAAHNPIPHDQDTSESEEDDSEEENSKSLCTFSEGPEDPARVCEEQVHGSDESLKEAAVVSKEKFSVTVSEVSTMSLENELAVESDSSLLIAVKPCSTENLTKNSFSDEETNQRHKENLHRSSFLKISNDKNSIQETEGISEDYNRPLLSAENKLRSYQIACDPDMETKLLSLNGEEKEISQCYNSIICNTVPDNAEDKRALKAEENSSTAWTFFSINLPKEELQQGSDTQVSISSWSEDKFLCEQRPQNMRQPKQTHTNSSTQLICCWSNEGLVKENHWVAVTEEAGNIISNDLPVSPAAEVHFDSLVEARATFMQHLSEANVPRNDAAPTISKRKGYRRIVNLAPKFNLPRQIAGSTEGGQEVPVKYDVPQKSVFDVEQKNFLSKVSGEEHEQNCALQEYSAPYSGTEATCSLPTPDADALLYDTSYIHSGQSSMPKYSCRACIVSRTKVEQDRTFKQQQVLDKKEGESEHVSSEVTNSQPDILSSVKAVSEYPEDSSTLTSCGENVNEADDLEPAEASQFEDNRDSMAMVPARTVMRTTGSIALLGPQRTCSAALSTSGTTHQRTSHLKLTQSREVLLMSSAIAYKTFFSSKLESLLPDDYVVPLDWKVSKMIYLLWKTSVEEKQKTNELQNGNALADYISLKDLNKNCQENQDSSETQPEMEQFQGVMEENIVTYPSTDCQVAVFHQS